MAQIKLYNFSHSCLRKFVTKTEGKEYLEKAAKQGNYFAQIKLIEKYKAFQEKAKNEKSSRWMRRDARQKTMEFLKVFRDFGNYAMLYHGRILEANAKKEEAINAYKTILFVDPKSKEAVDGLKRLYLCHRTYLAALLHNRKSA